jgi:hypothetical protein
VQPLSDCISVGQSAFFTGKTFYEKKAKKWATKVAQNALRAPVWRRSIAAPRVFPDVDGQAGDKQQCQADGQGAG